MKRNLTFFLAIVIATASGCLSNNNANPAPATPVGNFTGQFKRTRTDAHTGAVDSVRVNLNLSLANGAYKLTGDTTTIHAGSYGTYGVNLTYLVFTDKTVPPLGDISKVHLTGAYQYYYDGTTLQMAFVAPFDTLTYLYNFKKTN